MRLCCLSNEFGPDHIYGNDLQYHFESTFPGMLREKRYHDSVWL